MNDQSLILIYSLHDFTSNAPKNAKRKPRQITVYCFYCTIINFSFQKYQLMFLLLSLLFLYYFFSCFILNFQIIIAVVYCYTEIIRATYDVYFLRWHCGDMCIFFYLSRSHEIIIRFLDFFFFFIKKIAKNKIRFLDFFLIKKKNAKNKIHFSRVFFFFFLFFYK